MFMETKVCKTCGRELPIENFSKNAYGYIVNVRNVTASIAVRLLSTERTTRERHSNKSC